MVGTMKHQFRTLALTALLAAALPAWTQNKPEVTEITRQDFTKVDPLRSSKLAVFGLCLGQKEQESQSIVRSAGFGWKKTTYGVGQNTPAASIIDANGHEVGIFLRLTAGEIDRIDVSRELASRLAGDAPKLLSDDVIEPTSSTRLALLGKEDEYHHEDMPNGGGEYREFKYFKEGIEIDGIKFYGEDVVGLKLSLFAPAKPR